MSFLAKIFVDDEERNILNADYLFYQYKDLTGLPYSGAQGGQLDIELESTSNDRLWYDWMLSYALMKKGYIRFYNRDGMSKFFDIEFWDCYCTDLKETFRSVGTQPMKMGISLSAGIYRIRGLVFEKSWKVSDPFSKTESTESKEKEKRCIISFKASEDDFTQGNFGFDFMRGDYATICDHYEALKAEYTPLTVYGTEYFVPWLSIRKGQTVTLKLDKTIRGKFECVTLEHNEREFTVNVDNFENAKEVQISCNATLTGPVQLRLMADGTELAGALNVWKNTTKRMCLRWVFVKLQEGDADIKSLSTKVNKLMLEQCLLQGFNPTLIDIDLANDEYEVLDITALPKTYEENVRNSLKTGTSDEVPSDDISLDIFLDSIVTADQYRYDNIPANMRIDIEQTGVIYFANVKSIGANGQVTGVSGITPGTSIVFTKDNKSIASTIVHEVMHGLGLKHSFYEDKYIKKHTFASRTTDNFMDYDNKPVHTWKWQWEKLHESGFAK